MPLVRVDASEIVDELSTAELIRAIQRRRDRGDEVITGADKWIRVQNATEILRELQALDCPPELYALVKQWYSGHLSLSDCMALQKK
jgi:hypothetical protein